MTKLTNSQTLPTTDREDRPHMVNRRTFLRTLSLPVGAALLSACGASTASPTVTPASTTVPTAGAITSTVATTETTAITDLSTTASPDQDATPAIVAAVNAFLATLSATEQETLLFDWTDTEQKQRWSNFPEGAFQHAGLMMGNMSETQQNACLAVLQTLLSAEGYNRVLAEWKADDAVAAEDSGGGSGPQPSTPITGTQPITPSGGSQGSGAQGGGSGGRPAVSFGSAYYFAAIIGTPSATDPWQWQWGGHHITINATIVGPNISLTPSFIGVQPVEYTDANGNTVRPLGDIENDAFALIALLDATQQQAAVLGDTPIDVVLGPGQDGKTIQPEGLPASQMTADQQTAFLKLIGHYTGLINDEDAAVRMAEIQATLDATYLAWYGPTMQGGPAYFRVTGPAIVIEYSPQGDQPGSTPSAGAYHVHGIYRDPTNDYGAKYVQ